MQFFHKNFLFNSLNIFCFSRLQNGKPVYI